MHFRVSFPADSPLIGCEPFERFDHGGVGLGGDNPSGARLHFQWFHVSQLSSIDLRPSFLRESLAADVGGGVLHIVHDDQR